MCGCLSHGPHWGPGPQPRHVPGLGIELVTLWFAAHTQKILVLLCSSSAPVHFTFLPQGKKRPKNYTNSKPLHEKLIC